MPWPPASGLRIEGELPGVHVIGFGRAQPSLSWVLPAGHPGLRQTAYQVVAASTLPKLLQAPDLFETGRVESGLSIHVPWPGRPLGPVQAVFWRVRYWGPDGEASPWSEPATFETGLLDQSHWQGAWIGAPVRANGEPRPVNCFRRSFEVDRLPQNARVHVTAKGLYRIYLNNKCIHPQYALAPGWTDFDIRIHCQAYDVSNLLRAGSNVLAVELGDGWYYGMGVQYAFLHAEDFGVYGDEPRLLLQLDGQGTDGPEHLIVSDRSWRYHEGPIRHSSIYDGEDYDECHELAGWRESKFNDAAWRPVETEPIDPQVKIHPKPAAVVGPIDKLTAIDRWSSAPGTWILDFGQNMVGWPHIRVPVTANQKVMIRFAEMLAADGSFYTANYRGARSTNSYLPARDGVIDWTPAFTFHGFRYLEISGLPLELQPEQLRVVGIVLHTPMRPTGYWASSHPGLNQLQRNIIWGQKGNFLEVPTDCPQRDERLGWTGDAQVFCPTACFNFDTLSFWQKWLVDLADNQHATGEVPDVAPDIIGRMRQRHGEPIEDCATSGWADACAIIPWEVYVRYGDRRILADSYPMTRAWVEHCEKAANGYIYDNARFGDWLQPFQETRSEDFHRALSGDTPFKLISTAFFAHSTDLLRRSAKVLGFDEDDERFSALFASICETFQDTFFNTGGSMKAAPETQTGYVLALAFDLLPANVRPQAAERLASLVRDAKDHLRTGFLGTPHLCRVLDRFGYTALAYRVALQRSFPSWLYSVDQGATTIWERWNSYSETDGFADTQMNSFNHYAYGAIGQWLYERVAGIAPNADAPGYKHIHFRPAPTASLEYAEASLDSPHGWIRSRWELRGDSFELEVVVPSNSSASVFMPDAPSLPKQVAAGTHRFSCRWVPEAFTGLSPC